MYVFVTLFNCIIMAAESVREKYGIKEKLCRET